MHYKIDKSCLKNAEQYKYKFCICGEGYFRPASKSFRLRDSDKFKTNAVNWFNDARKGSAQTI